MFRPAIEEMNPETGVEESLKRKNNHVYQWQTIRLATETHAHVLYELTSVTDVERFAKVYDHLLFSKLERESQQDNAHMK